MSRVGLFVILVSLVSCGLPAFDSYVLPDTKVAREVGLGRFTMECVDRGLIARPIGTRYVNSMVALHQISHSSEDAANKGWEAAEQDLQRMSEAELIGFCQQLNARLPALASGVEAEYQQARAWVTGAGRSTAQGPISSPAPVYSTIPMPSGEVDFGLEDPVDDRALILGEDGLQQCMRNGVLVTCR